MVGQRASGQVVAASAPQVWRRSVVDHVRPWQSQEETSQPRSDVLIRTACDLPNRRRIVAYSPRVMETPSRTAQGRGLVAGWQLVVMG